MSRRRETPRTRLRPTASTCPSSHAQAKEPCARPRPPAPCPRPRTLTASRLYHDHDLGGREHPNVHKYAVALADALDRQHLPAPVSIRHRGSDSARVAHDVQHGASLTQPRIELDAPAAAGDAVGGHRNQHLVVVEDARPSEQLSRSMKAKDATEDRRGATV